MTKRVFADKRSIIIIVGIVVCCLVSYFGSKIFPQDIANLLSMGLTMAILFLCATFSRLVQVINMEYQQEEKEKMKH